MTLNQILYFNMIVKTGNMRQAAEQLYIAQPSLSASIACLEKELGVKLFHRRHQRLHLTPEGEAFLEHAEIILHEIESARNHIEQMSEKRETMLRIGSISTPFCNYFPDIFCQFLALPENKNVQFTLDSENTLRLVYGLEKGIYDIILCSKTNDPTLKQYPIISNQLIFLCPRDKYSKPETWEALTAMNLIGYEKKSTMDGILEDIALSKNVHFNFVYRAPNEESIVALVEHGLGPALLPRNSYINHQLSVEYPLPYNTVIQRQIYLTIKKDFLYYGATGRFIDFLLQKAKEDSPDK